MKLVNVQLWEGLHVVWIEDHCVTFHRANLHRGFFRGASLTLCGEPVWQPVLEAKNIEEDLKIGRHNCPECFKQTKEKT